MLGFGGGGSDEMLVVKYTLAACFTGAVLIFGVKMLVLIVAAIKLKAAAFWGWFHGIKVLKILSMALWGVMK